MTITLDLPSELEARFIAEARDKGLPIAEGVKAHLLDQALAPVRPEQMTPEDIDKAFEEIADMIPENIPPIPDEMLSRESICIREDEWNRR
jgi:hypothetical protein